MKNTPPCWRRILNAIAPLLLALLPLASYVSNHPPQAITGIIIGFCVGVCVVFSWLQIDKLLGELDEKRKPPPSDEARWWERDRPI